MRYIRYNNNLSLRYYSRIEDVNLSDLLIQASINTVEQLIVFFDSRWQYFPDTGRSTGEYIVFYQGEPIDHFTHVPGPVSQSISESEYNLSCTAGMSLAHLRMQNNCLLNKYIYVVPEQAPLIILDIKSSVFMAKNGNDTKHTRHISIRRHFLKMVKSAICTRNFGVR